MASGESVVERPPKNRSVKNPLLVITDEESREWFRRLPLPEECLEIILPWQAACCLLRTAYDLVVIDLDAEPEIALHFLNDFKGRNPSSPALVLVSPPAEEIKFRALQLGARDCWIKPVDGNELRDWVRHLLSLKRQNPVSRDRLDNAPYPEFCQTMADRCRSLPEGMIRVLRHMEKHLSDDLDLAGLARVAGMSRHHFCRSFKRYFGLTPIRFLNYLKVQRAKRILMENGLSLSTVAMKAGFNDYGSFCKYFRQFEQMTPSGYRHARLEPSKENR